MPSPVPKIAKRAVRFVPSPVLRWGLRLGVRLLLPLAGAAAAAGLERIRHRFGPRIDPAPDGTVTVEINRDLRELAPDAGSPAEPLAVLAERAYLTLARVPGRPVTCLRAVPKLPGDDIREDVALAQQPLEP